MKYLVRVNADENHTLDYVIEAESGDEAEENFYAGEIIDDTFNETTYFEIELVEPYEG